MGSLFFPLFIVSPKISFTLWDRIKNDDDPETF